MGLRVTNASEIPDQVRLLEGNRHLTENSGTAGALWKRHEDKPIIL